MAVNSSAEESCFSRYPSAPTERALWTYSFGYFLKKDAGTELFSAIEKIRKGKVYVSPSLSGDLTDHWEGMREGVKKGILTNREKEVLSLTAGGQSNKEIADLLYISVHTVERHRANRMEKLIFKKTADLVKYTVEKGYV